jgi:hypothetical protein
MLLLDKLADQPVSFFLCFATISILVGEAVAKRQLDWAIPSLVAYATVGAWYLIEPLYLPEGFTRFSSDILDDAFLQVTGFLLTFRIAVPIFTNMVIPSAQFGIGGGARIPAETYLLWLVLFWFCLVVVGINRMGGDFVEALFPTGGRWTGRMWGRAAAGDAGPMGFLVSLAAYLYTLICASFGILLPFLRRRWAWFMAILMIGLSWPYFLLDGSRNIFLAVFIPSVASYLLFSRHSVVIKGLICTGLFLGVDTWFRIVIAYRNTGFVGVFEENTGTLIAQTKHYGLNMMSELCFINSFYESGLLQLSFGQGYVEEFLNFIPRAVWPDKPLLGIDYAILRGFGSSTGDLGVFATVSTGLVGQGVRNFGIFFGPAMAALLFAVWIAILARFRRQGDSVLRLSLFLLGLGLTFNLGRDLTLLVLWPFALGYLLVRVLECYRSSDQTRAGSPQKGLSIGSGRVGPILGQNRHGPPKWH